MEWLLEEVVKLVIKQLELYLEEEVIIEELNKLRGAAILHGLRGAPAVDVRAVARAIALVGTLMRSREDIQEIDINPLVVGPKGVMALDVLLVSEAAC